MRVDLPEVQDAVSPPEMSVPLSGGNTVPVSAGQFHLQRLQLTEGLSAGVELLLVESDLVRVAICPTRGMSLWKAHLNGIPCGWKSPVHGPVHPNWVAIDESSGIGWLDGFDELLVRCGLRNFGAPDFDDQGRLQYPLHGRVGNLPARNLSVSVDPSHSLLEVTATVDEVRFLQTNLRLQVKYSFMFGVPRIDVHDVVTNVGGSPTTIQMLYHVNMGAPLLEGGAKMHVPANKIVARDAHAASDLAHWKTYLPPTADYKEQVYFSDANADSSGWASALLSSADASRGFAVHFRTNTLPYFTQWKNTVAESDGYVTGLEPGTGFPNPRSFEDEHGRVVPLEAGESREFQVRLEGINDRKALANMATGIDALQSTPLPTHEHDADWCVPR